MSAAKAFEHNYHKNVVFIFVFETLVFMSVHGWYMLGAVLLGESEFVATGVPSQSLQSQTEDADMPVDGKVSAEETNNYDTWKTILRAVAIFAVVATIAIGYLVVVKDKLVEKEIKTISEGINYIAFASEKPVHLHFG